MDSKGRIALPKEVRERLGNTPGTGVEVREDDGKMIDEPGDDPRQIIERMEKLIGDTSSRPRDQLPSMNRPARLPGSTAEAVHAAHVGDSVLPVQDGAALAKTYGTGTRVRAYAA